MGSSPSAPGPTFVAEPEDVRRRTNVLTQAEQRRRATGGRASAILGSAPVLSPDTTPQGVAAESTFDPDVAQARIEEINVGLETEHGAVVPRNVKDLEREKLQLEAQIAGADPAALAAFRQNKREGSKETFAHFIGQDVRERERKRTAALSRRRGAATRTTTLLGSARA